MFRTLADCQKATAQELKRYLIINNVRGRSKLTSKAQMIEAILAFNATLPVKPILIAKPDHTVYADIALPQEILIKEILPKVSPQDLIRLAQGNKMLNRAVSENLRERKLSIELISAKTVFRNCEHNSSWGWTYYPIDYDRFIKTVRDIFIYDFGFAYPKSMRELNQQYYTHYSNYMNPPPLNSNMYPTYYIVIVIVIDRGNYFDMILAFTGIDHNSAVNLQTLLFEQYGLKTQIEQFGPVEYYDHKYRFM